MTNILLYFGSGIGLGDCVMLTILLKHFKKFRPDWIVDVHCQPDHAPILAPHCHAIACFGAERLGNHYDQLIKLDWGEQFELFADRPSTKVCYALKNTFGIQEYDPELGRYEVPLPADRQKVPMVVAHFKGASHCTEKNLSDEDAKTIEEFAIKSGMYVANMKMKVADLTRIVCKASAFIGIDSGPGKIASATDVPTLIVWTGHHPLRHHDPAPNTTHLIPQDWREMEPLASPVGSHSYVIAQKAYQYFIDNYKFMVYRPESLATEACRWLEEVIHGQDTPLS